MVFSPILVLLLFFPILIDGNCGVSQKCQCKDIPNAPVGRLSEIESTKHLSHRQTFSAGLTISDTCKVTVDISKSTVDNFFLVFLRDPENPLIFRRFTKSMDKSIPVELTDLKCVNEGGDEFKWYHGPVKVADSFEVTLLSDEECGCVIPTGEYPIEVNQLDGSCNGYHLKCPGGQVPNLAHEPIPVQTPLIEAVSEEIILAETTCVNGNLYFEGTKLEEPRFFCMYSGVNFNSQETIDFVTKCRCDYDFVPTSITLEDMSRENWDKFTRVLSITGDLKTRTSVYGNFELNITDCSSKLICPEGKTPTILSASYKPIMYELNESPIIHCASPPASYAFSQTTDSNWWAKGVQVKYLHYTCYD